MGAPQGLTLPQLKTDAQGFLSLRMGPGHYRLFPNQADGDPDLMFSAASFEWPLPSAETVITLESLGF